MRSGFLMKKGLIGALVLLVVGAVVFFHMMDLKRQIEPMAIKDISGDPLALVDGRPMIINFWSTNCIACLEEIPHLEALYQKFREQGFRVLGVAVSYDDPLLVKRYAENRKIKFPILYDHDSKLSNQFGKVHVVPMNFLLDGEGRILNQTMGKPDWEVWEKKIEMLFSMNAEKV